MNDWQVGAEVYWIENDYSFARTGKIARVTKTRLTLEDGSIWNAGNGFKWGRRSYRDPSIALLDDAGRARMEEHNERMRLRARRHEIFRDAEPLVRRLQARLRFSENAEELERLERVVAAMREGLGEEP